jgi:hypothetical protein
LCVYNFKQKKLRRAIPIKSLAGITKNLTKDSQEFVIHVANEHDYRMFSEQ